VKRSGGNSASPGNGRLIDSIGDMGDIDDVGDAAARAGFLPGASFSVQMVAFRGVAARSVSGERGDAMAASASPSTKKLIALFGGSQFAGLAAERAQLSSHWSTVALPLQAHRLWRLVGNGRSESRPC
jgi:hypothetical protein